MLLESHIETVSELRTQIYRQSHQRACGYDPPDLEQQRGDCSQVVRVYFTDLAQKGVPQESEGCYALSSSFSEGPLLPNQTLSPPRQCADTDIHARAMNVQSVGKALMHYTSYME